MTEKRFSFGVDIPMSWKQKTLKNERRFSDLEGFLDEDYDGEHHMLWDNQKKKWCHLDDALSVMEEEYYSTKNENEQLKSKLEESKKAHSNCDKLWWELHDEKEQLEKQNEQLKQFKDKVFEVIDNHILEETDLRKECIENGSHYTANISRNIIDTLKLIKKEIEK